MHLVRTTTTTNQGAAPSAAMIKLNLKERSNKNATVHNHF
uniref:Uncharacterized protein n=1 Tax=Arundo donax TaxID=35708 RepID=A0A0A9EP28_ARUDO